MASEWSRDPSEDQQRYYELLGDAYAYEPKTSNGRLILRRKVGYAIFGIPDEESKCGNAHTGYNEMKYNTIKAVVDFIMEVNNEKTTERDRLEMAIIFVFVEYEKQVQQYPVFRILLTKSEWKFVDTNFRVYPSWADFLIFNELPEGKFCWPLNGIYSSDSEDNVWLGWGLTPAAKPAKKAIEALDKVNSVVSVGATAVCLVGLFTPLGPVMATASFYSGVTGTYNFLRTGASLIDRGSHGQTVNPLTDHQVAMSWLSVAGSAVGVAAGAATNRVATLARNGEVMSKTGRITCNALNVTSLAINATGIGIGAVSLKKRIKEDEATPLEVFQFTASVLFFTHATVNFQTASQVIKETQRGVIEDFEKSLRSNRHRKQFKKLEKNTVATGENVVDGNAKVIRGIRSINNKDDYFAGMVRTRREFGGHKAVFSENGNIIVNGGAEIHPMKLYELGKQQRREFLSLAKQASQGTISEATFRARFDSVLSSNTANSHERNISLNSDAMEAENTLPSQLQEASPGLTIGRREVLIIASVVDQLTDLICSSSDNKYAKWWQLIWHQVSMLIMDMYEIYDEALHLAKQLHKFKDERSFNLEQGIETENVLIHFVNNIHERYKHHVDQLKNDLEKLKTSEKLKNTENLKTSVKLKTTENLKTNDEICPRCKQAV